MRTIRSRTDACSRSRIGLCEDIRILAIGDSIEGTWSANMNFAQVCRVTCAVMAFVGSGDDRDTTNTRVGAPAHQVGAGDARSAPGAWQATAVSAATTMGTPATIDLIADPHAAQSRSE